MTITITCKEDYLNLYREMLQAVNHSFAAKTVIPTFQ